MHNWEEFLQPYELTTSEIKLKLEGIRKQFKQKNKHSPIESVRVRVKTIASILEKSERMDLTLDRIGEEMYDIAGVRITCKFVEDIFKVVEMLKNRSDIDIITEIDYITNPKDSGYRSYHLHGYYHLETIDGTKQVLFEVQIRTMAMNFWASIEHTMHYKYSGDIPENVSIRLIKAAEAAYALDNEMSQIKHEIEEAQEHFKNRQNQGLLYYDSKRLMKK
nr:GTP pyrophosphokinase family protein [Haloplasma contractile]